jgi:histidine triad (HIT) family protein
MQTEDCIFCRIVNGTEKAHIIWENDEHMAFLSIFPNTVGFTVVITKDHYSSYNFDLADDVLCKLIIASKTVGKLLDKSFANVSRTGLIMEGFGVDHVHTKLIPMHGTGDMKQWKAINSKSKKFFDVYEGYLSSHDCDRASDTELEKIAGMIIRNKNTIAD